jgi:hypothetical protein
MSEVGPGPKQKTLPEKQTKAKRHRGAARMVEFLHMNFKP